MATKRSIQVNFNNAKRQAKELSECALAVGSDVPFFLCKSDAAVVSGCGDIVVPIEARTDLKFCLIRSLQPKAGTAQAYAMLDRMGTRTVLPSENYLLSMYRKPVCEWAFENDFEKINTAPEGVDAGKGKLYLSGAGNMWYLVTDGILFYDLSAFGE